MSFAPVYHRIMRTSAYYLRVNQGLNLRRKTEEDDWRQGPVANDVSSFVLSVWRFQFVCTWCCSEIRVRAWPTWSKWLDLYIRRIGWFGLLAIGCFHQLVSQIRCIKLQWSVHVPRREILLLLGSCLIKCPIRTLLCGMQWFRDMRNVGGRERYRVIFSLCKEMVSKGYLISLKKCPNVYVGHFANVSYLRGLDENLGS